MPLEKVLIQSLRQLQQVRNQFDVSVVPGFDEEDDPETGEGSRPTGLRPLVGLALANDEIAFYCPFAHHNLGAGEWNIPRDKALEILGLNDIPVTTQYGKSDYTNMLPYGVKLNIQRDTYIMARLLFFPSAVTSFGLKDMAFQFLEMEMHHIEEFIGSNKTGRISDAPMADVASYCMDDAIACYRLGKLFREKVLTSKRGIAFQMLVEAETRLQALSVDMTVTGIALDPACGDELQTSLVRDLEELQSEIAVYLPDTYLGSPQSLSIGLYETLGLPTEGIRKGKLGHYSTDVYSLNTLVDVHPVIQMVQQWRQLSTLLKNFVNKFAWYARERGDIHPNFEQFGTITGRFSSSGEMNGQNIPNHSERGLQVRKIFVARSGCVLFSIDYSQIELKIPAYWSGDPELIRRFESGWDLHRYTASICFNVPYEKVTKQQRQDAKRINFGLIYGKMAGAFIPFFKEWDEIIVEDKIDELSGEGYTERRQVHHDAWGEAHRMLKEWFAPFPVFYRFLMRMKEMGLERGYTETYYGRRVWIGKCAKGEPRYHAMGNVASNYPVQGTGGDIMKIVMPKIQSFYDRLHLPARILLTIHDELIIECELAVLPQCWRAARSTMETEHGFPCKVLTTETEIGYNLYEMQPYTGLEDPIELLGRRETYVKEVMLPNAVEMPVLRDV